MSSCLKLIGRHFGVILKLMLEKWCAPSKVTTFEGLQELILLEVLKNCLPQSLVVHLNEQKVSAVMADEYMLTHKNVFVRCRPTQQNARALEAEHLIADCKAWKHKNASKIKKVAHAVLVTEGNLIICFQPFLTNGTVLLSINGDRQHVSVLCDTDSGQSFIRKGILPLSNETYTGTDVLVHGIELGCVKLQIRV